MKKIFSEDYVSKEGISELSFKITLHDLYSDNIIFGVFDLIG
jgi:hypothetical protein